MEKDIEKDLEGEREFLLQIQEHIGHEIENRLRSLGDLKQEIVDYRKYLFEEIPQKQHHLLNHDNPIREANYTATYERIGELSRMYYHPYFGMICFRDPDESEDEYYYIGKSGLSDKGEPIILDWRTPVASLFYQQRLGEMTYKAPSGTFAVELLKRRQYILRNGILKGMFDSEIDIKDDILQMVLSGNSGARLKDIIATIQKEQDDIIREPLEHNIMLNGVAGSGKTTIVLHRIAYLLYNYRSRLQDNVLIIGPNHLFMEYISDVLPDLGEREGTFQMTVSELAQEIVKPRRAVLSAADYYKKIAGDSARFQKEMARKTAAAFKSELDSAFRKYEEKQTATKDLVFQDHVLMSAEERNKLFFKTHSKLPYIRRIQKIMRLIRHRLKDLRNDTVRRLMKAYRHKMQAAKADSNFYLANDLRSESYEVLRKYLKEVYLYGKTLRDLYPVPDTEDWYASVVKKGADEPWNEDDLCGLLYVYCKLYGRGAYPVKHLVIDEAQDLSAFGFLMLKTLTGAESYTIVGDVHQRVKGSSHVSMMDNWKKLMRPAELERLKYYELRCSYRSTPQIMEYASAFVNNAEEVETIDREGVPVCQESYAGAVELSRKVGEILKDMRAQGRERIAFLCRTAKEAERIEKALKKRKETYNIILDERDSLECEIAIIPVYFAKGLEFDGVVMVEFSDSKWDAWTSYILATRALHQLVHLKEVKAAAEAEQEA